MAIPGGGRISIGGGVEGTEIFQEVIHQADKLGPWQVQDLKGAVEVVEVI